MIKAYHVTSSKHLDSIFEHGLLKEKFVDEVVYLFKSYERAVNFMSWDFKELNCIIVFNINERKLKRGQCYDSIKEYFYEYDVKPNKIIGAFFIDDDLKLNEVSKSNNVIKKELIGKIK